MNPPKGASVTTAAECTLSGADTLTHVSRAEEQALDHMVMSKTNHTSVSDVKRFISCTVSLNSAMATLERE
jgi:hypothetical protein